MRKRVFFLGIALALGLLAGCGAGASTSSPPATSGQGSSNSSMGSTPAGTMGTSTMGNSPSSGSMAANAMVADQITLANGVFSPSTLSVAVGTKVTFIFNGMGTDHILFTAPSTFASTALVHGESWTYTFNQPGTYQFEAQAMPNIKGTVTVR